MDAFDVEDDEMIGEMSPSVNEVMALVGDLEMHGNEESAMQNGISLHPRSLPFVLSFSNLTYSVKVGQKLSFSKCFSGQKVEVESKTLSISTKTLLDGISGEAREGEIMAVLGASGSGKSTLIDALANRILKGSLKGTIMLNGEPLESQLLKTISAYVMQDDLLYPMLTVEETMMFSAEFRLPRSLSKSKKRARVQALIDQLGLRDAAKTVIGDEGHRGVSGGERRRVSIGIDIIHDPIILFLDEPTSGLDSTSAFMVVKVLKKIAQAGGMVIMSIHQPSYRIISLLDKMIFLSKGQTVFSGSPATILSYFSELGHPVPENENPTEFALDLILELEGLPNGTTRLVEFNKSWESNNNPVVEHGGNLWLKQAITSRGKLLSGEVNSNSDATMPTFANPLWSEIITLSRRSTMNSFRSPQPFGTLGAIIVTATILATLFWKLDDSPRGIQERLGFFAFSMSTTYYCCAHTLPLFVQERYIFMRETAYNTYRRSSYVIARSIVVIPPLTFLALTFSSITFWAVGLDGGGSGFLFYFSVILSAFWAGNSFVTFLSVVVPDIIIGFTIVVAILAYFFLFSGYFIARIRIPDYWIWFHYISLVKYPYEALMQNEFSTPNKCFVRGIQVFDNTALDSISDSLKTELLKSISATFGMNVTSSTCITTGTDVLLQQGITQLSKWSCLWITVAWGFFYRVLFYFSLMLGSKNKRS